MPDLSRTEVSCHYVPKKIVHIFDAFWLMLILIAQQTIINYYIIMRFKESLFPYFFFVLDFLSLCFFVGTLCVAYNHLKKSLYEDCGDGFKIRRQRISILPLWMGQSPLSYISWLFYAIILVVKIVLIFHEEEFVKSLSVKNHFGPQLLKVGLASSSLVFLLLIEGHNWKKRGTPSYSYITSVCAKTGIEVFDSVSMLSILMEGPEGLSSSFRDIILALAAINFFLPSVKLYQLSFPDFSSHDYSLPITVLYMLLHMCLIDLPFLGVRLYLWLGYRENASMFLMKNLLAVILTLRGMYPDLVEFRKDYLSRKRRTAAAVMSPEGVVRPAGGFEEIALSDKTLRPANV